MWSCDTYRFVSASLNKWLPIPSISSWEQLLILSILLCTGTFSFSIHPFIRTFGVVPLAPVMHTQMYTTHIFTHHTHEYTWKVILYRNLPTIARLKMSVLSQSSGSVCRQSPASLEPMYKQKRWVLSNGETGQLYHKDLETMRCRNPTKK